MKKVLLSQGEWKLMNLLWNKSPLTIRDMVSALKEDTAWSKATVNIMLNRLAEKGAIQIDVSQRQKQMTPVLTREDAVRTEARQTLEKIQTNGIGLLLSTMVQDCKLSEEELGELYHILDGIKDDDG